MKELAELNTKQKEGSLTSLEFANDQYLMELKERKLKKLKDIEYNQKKYNEYITSHQNTPNTNIVAKLNQQDKFSINNKSNNDNNSNKYNYNNETKIFSPFFTDLPHKDFHRYQRTKPQGKRIYCVEQQPSYHQTNIISNLSSPNTSTSQVNIGYSSPVELLGAVKQQGYIKTPSNENWNNNINQNNIQYTNNNIGNKYSDHGLSLNELQDGFERERLEYKNVFYNSKGYKAQSCCKSI